MKGKPEMKAFYVMFVVFAVLLLGAPSLRRKMAGRVARGAIPTDPTGHGFVAECYIGPPTMPPHSSPQGWRLRPPP